MPLSEPDYPREHWHTRNVECFGYRRGDGMWDIEGHIVDTKTYGFPNAARGEIQAGEPIHDMWLRLTLDDSYEIKAVEAVTDNGPFTICGDITPRFQELVGLRIGPGWTRKVKERLGGVHGCTHLVELLGPIATVSYQTIAPGQARLAREAGKRPTVSKTRPRHLGSCHALRLDGPVVKESWPDWYTGSD